MRPSLTVVGETCPVCGGEAERGQSPGDAVQWACPRCGPFVITGTALAMLTSRLQVNDRSPARASHAIRSATSEEHKLEIDSTNVDRLVASPLPRVERQIENFLNWMSSALGDDHLGVVQLPNDISHLAGIVGALDGERVKLLLDHMQNEALIERLSDNRIRLTVAAWRRLPGSQPQPSPTSNISSADLDFLGSRSMAEAAFPIPDKIKAHCRYCGPSRNAEVVSRHVETQDDDEMESCGIIDDYRILRCGGCSGVYVQRINFFAFYDDIKFDQRTGEYSNVDDMEIEYWPAPSRREPPVWLLKIDDHVIRSLMDEIYSALDADLRTVGIMGIRAVLDRTFELAGADPTQGFAEKLTALEKLGVISRTEKELLLIITDAGSAASHRGWKPEAEELDSILDATQALLQRIALLGTAAKKMGERMPPRPKRSKDGGTTPDRPS